MRVRWTRGASRDLELALDSIGRDRPQAARIVGARIQEAVAKLGEYPLLGRQGRIPGTRELIVPRTPFIVPYRLQGETVEILSVFHAARLWPEQF
jgi:toxin ParE1/3/4